MVQAKSGLLRDFTPLKCERNELPCVSPAHADHHISLCDALALGRVDAETEDDTSEETQSEIGIRNGDFTDEEAGFCSEQRWEGPSLLDEESLFFIGDEVGELTLGSYGGEGNEECLLDFQLEDETHAQNDQWQTKSIRRTIATTISPMNRMKSPCGVDIQLHNDFDWIEQQQVHRQKSFQPKKVKTAEHFSFVTGTPQPKGQRLMDIVETSPSAFSYESDVGDVYPDTPSHSNALKFLEIPDIVSPTLQSRGLDQRSDRDEVKTSLPEPDSFWYESFFGAETRFNATQARIRSARKSSIQLMSRISEFSFPNRWNQSEVASPNKALRLEDILSDEELLALNGYKDYGNGLAEC